MIGSVWQGTTRDHKWKVRVLTTNTTTVTFTILHGGWSHAWRATTLPAQDGVLAGLSASEIITSGRCYDDQNVIHA